MCRPHWLFVALLRLTLAAASWGRLAAAVRAGSLVSSTGSEVEPHPHAGTSWIKSEPVSPALADTFLTTAPGGKPCNLVFASIKWHKCVNYLGIQCFLNFCSYWWFSRCGPSATGSSTWELARNEFPSPSTDFRNQKLWWVGPAIWILTSPSGSVWDWLPCSYLT